MPVPAFLQDLLTDETQERLRMGVPSGYIMITALAVFAAVFQWQGLVGNIMPMFYIFIPLKYVTNTLMWWALVKRKQRLIWITINQLADIVVLTAIVYFTGGPASPLASLYLLVLGVIAALSNIGATIAVAITMVVLYSTMLILIAAGVSTLHPPILQTVFETTGTTWSVVVLDVAKLATMLAMLAVAISGIVQVLRDREAQLRDRNEELKEASRLKSEFVANMTHELRTPIHGVLGLAEMLDDGIYGELNERQKIALENINRSATGLLDMVDDLLSLERVESGRLSIRVVQAKVPAILEAAAETAQWMSGKKQHAIHVECSPKINRAFTDPDLVEHILVNLVSNAVKFTPAGGDIWLRASTPDGRTLVLEVEDTGIGIAPEFHARIFQAFRQVDASSSRQYGGAGLGLTVVSRLAEMLSAQVEFESEVGRGTKFTIEIPQSVIPVDSEESLDALESSATG